MIAPVSATPAIVQSARDGSEAPEGERLKPGELIPTMYWWVLTTKPLPGDAEPASRDESGGRSKLMFSVPVSVLPHDITPPSEMRLPLVEKPVLVPSPSKFGSVIGYFAKMYRYSVRGKSTRRVGRATIVLEHFHSTHVSFPLPFNVRIPTMMTTGLESLKGPSELGFLSSSEESKSAGDLRLLGSLSKLIQRQP